MSEPTLHEQASRLFLELRALPAGERETRLGAITDPRMAQEVRSLLDYDVRDDVATIDTATPGPPPAPLPGLPRAIGPYMIIRRLGQGGSGYVLLAEQHTPVRRQVAIKIVPHAATNPESAARFDFERRSLERAEHPNIARILDAGTTQDGLPYLVMDFVEGEPINRFCREHALPLGERITLVRDVAAAVQHAHIRGVIHRDLKPANILVGSIAGKPTPRILDFGIAKPTPDAVDENSPRTIGVALGTPAYMAPEQTGGQTVDTRADIYSLGAILYELASGVLPIPFDSQDARTDLAELFRRIRDDVPPPASRVRVADPHLSGAASADRALMTDLDSVLAKALEKAPERRYLTVAAFADDLEHLLKHEPVSARPPTVTYRAARFCRRHRALVASLAVVGLGIIVGVAGLVTGLLEARRQRHEAVNQADAQRELNRFLTDDLLGAASPEQEGEKITALDLLHRASARVEHRFDDRPLIAAAIHHALGNAYAELGAFEDAQRHIDRAIALRREFAGPDAPDTVVSEAIGASLLARQQRLPEAEAALTAAVRRCRDILGTDSPVLYSAINDLGTVYIGMDKGQQAVELLEEARAGRARLLDPHDPQVFATTANLAQAYERLGQTERCLQMQIEALKLADSFAEQPRMTLIGLCNNIGATLLDLDRGAEAATYLRRAADMASTWLGADNPAALTIKSNLAGLETKLGDPETGARLYESVAKALSASVGPDALDTFTARYGYCNSLRLARHDEEAVKAYAALLADLTRVLTADHWLTVQTEGALARTYFDSGHADLARPYAQDALDRFQRLYGPEHERTKMAQILVDQIRAGR